jgi:hypothetical protein
MYPVAVIGTPLMVVDCCVEPLITVALDAVAVPELMENAVVGGDMEIERTWITCLPCMQ